MRVSLRRIIEGRTSLYVPKKSLLSLDPPTTPIFFNPAARVNRDLSVAITEVTKGDTFCDSLAGIGSRGVRIANELPRRIRVTLVDFNERALRTARKNAGANGVEGMCEFVKSETSAFLFSRFRRDSKFDFVDLDPFGTPVPYLQGGFNAASSGGVLSVTATDTAVLCGVRPEVTFRRYLSIPLKNEFKHETAIRILVNACRRIAGMNDIGVEALAAHSTRHYIRVYLRVRAGATEADSSAKFEGFVTSCRRCGHRVSTREPIAKCQRCSARVVSAGPLWVGPLADQSIISAAAEVCKRERFVEGLRALNGLIGVNELPPYGYSLEEVCSTLKVPGVSLRGVTQRLASAGYKVLKQPFEKTGLKTDADYSAVADAVLSASRVRGEPLHARQT